MQKYKIFYIVSDILKKVEKNCSMKVLSPIDVGKNYSDYRGSKPRRGFTHAVQLTPYERSEDW